MGTFYEQTARGDALGALATAASFSALWAIGSAWSNAIRAISLQLFPHETMDIVLAEVSAAIVTTFLGLAIALTISRSWKCCSSCCTINYNEEKQQHRGTIRHVTPRSQTIVSRT